MISAGDILLLNFPFSSSEQTPFKQRPVLVLAEPVGRGIEEAVLVAMITSSGDRLATPRATDVILDHEAAGLPRPSVVRVTRVWTAETRDIVRAFGRVTDADLARVREVFRATFSL